MIKWIHQNKRSVTVFLIAGAVVLSMGLFSKADMGINNRQSRYAIKIDSDTISFDQFQLQKRERQQAMMDQYRRIFGDKANQYMKQIYNIPNQQIVDGFISEKLISKEAGRLKLYVGEDEVKDTIRHDMFQGQFDGNVYASFLAQKGKTSRAFEDELRLNLLQNDYHKILTDASLPSNREIQHYLMEQETSYDVNYLEINPADFEKAVDISNNSVLETYYNSHQTDFEIPARATYTYVVFDPEKNSNLVEISDDDIQVYYSDHESKFMTPESIRVRHIQLTIPKDADQKKRDEIKNKAEEAHAKATAGEPFEALVTQYSDDAASIANAGDLGWLNKGKMDKRFDQAAFALKTPGIAPLVTTDYGYHIIKVEEYKAPELKKLEDVKSDIQAEIRKREAPAYIAAKAQEAFQVWSKGEKDLNAIAKNLNLSVATTKEALSKENDPDSSLKGLTKQVITMNDLKQQIIELGDKSVLVQVDKYEESRVPNFSEAKDNVISVYRKEQSKKLSREAAEKALTDVKGGKLADLKSVSDQLKLKMQEQKALSRKTPGSGIFADKEIQSSIFSTFAANNKPNRVFSVAGKNYLIGVSNITAPKTADIESKVDSYREQAIQKNSTVLYQSNLNRMKAAAEIDVDRSLMKDEPEV